MQPHSRKGVFTMTIEIHQPELEALIHERMQSGAFQSIEDFLLQTLRATPKPVQSSPPLSGRTGADLIAALQSIPYKDVDLEPYRPHMPVSDPVEF
jgi:hypothetical protein